MVPDDPTRTQEPAPELRSGAFEAPRATVLFDGTCGFCKRWVARWRAQAGPTLDFVPFQEHPTRFGIPEEDLRRAVHLVEPGAEPASTTGPTVRAGAAAVARLRALGGIGDGMWAAYRLLPGFAPLAELGYRVVAAHRPAASRAATLLLGRSLEPSTWLLSRWLLLRGLGVVLAIAFWSFHVQARGLVGSGGILPMRERFAPLAGELGASRWWKVPTLFWASFSDAALDAAGLVGIALGAALALGLAPRLVLALAWALYLSVSTVASPFLDFQWDTLLLESLFVAFLLAPRGLWRPGLAADRPPSPLARGLAWWLIVRLMLGSGLVKLASGDERWRDLTAMGFHYLTQPLPNPLAWYADALPPWTHTLEAAAMFAIELVLPFLVVLPRRPRALACAGFVALQVAIGATGNYGFFNLLSALLCVTLLDDAQLGRVVPGALRARLRPAWELRRTRSARLHALAILAAASVVAVTGLVQWRRVDPGLDLPAPVREAVASTRPFRTFNAYGLFAVMTTERVELVFEGSNDGATWRAYGFRYKPDERELRPALVQPHMPRLDWQLWFASLDLRGSAYWVRATMRRLLEGSDDVLALFATNPFPDAPPRFVRVVAYRFEFAEPDARAEGAWWRVTPLGVAVVPLSLPE